MLHILNYNLQSSTRQAIREELICLFLKEEPGFKFDENNLNPTKYIYVVETIENYKIYLQRPAQLNKGFDFIVNVENMYFKFEDKRRHRNPSHQDITKILLSYRQYKEYYKIQNIINKIFKCENLNIVKETENLPCFINYDNEQIPIAVILYCIKWLFIEQDITYWNWSGRYMLFKHLQQSNLV